MKKENLFKSFDYEARLKEQGKYEEETKRRWVILMPIKNLREEPRNILKRTGLKSCLLKMTMQLIWPLPLKEGFPLKILRFRL